MNLNSLFDDLPKTSSSKSDDLPDDVLKIPIRDSATLNQLLYKNETYNNRKLPINVDKKPLHEMLKSSTTSMSELNDMIDTDINNLLSKAWYQIPIKLKRDLIEKYCEKNDIELNEESISIVLKDRTLVKYNRKACCIETIKV
jgi:hypothetical protein